MRIAIIVLSCFDKSIYQELYNTQNETWNSIEVQNVDTYFLVGNCEYNSIEGNIIKTNAPETLFCSHKVIEGYKLIESLNYDFIFRTNSSSYVDKQKLFEYINSNCDENTYSGVIGEYGHIKFASGCGYILSKKNLEKIVRNVTLWDYQYRYDDVCLGDLMSKLSIPVTPAPRQDIISDFDYIDPNYYHYRLKTGHPDRCSIEIERFKKIFNLKIQSSL